MTTFAEISNKIKQKIRLSVEDAIFLFEQDDFISLAHLADQVNQEKNHGRVFYNINRHINPTNVCALSCKFCAYSRKPGEDGAYEYSIDEIVTKAKAAVANGATEVHMVGGLHPRWRLSHYVDILKAVKENCKELHIKGFTAVEIDWLAKKARKSITEVITILHEAGLDSLPGGGAEIFHPDVRKAICAKLTAEEWLTIHKHAHSLGLHSNCTMLYGHVETYAHRVDHMDRLRKLQDETKYFNAFIPLAFQPFQNEMGIERYTYGIDDLKTIAVARLFLDNFKHIKAYWIMLGQDIAQLALRCGANDIDGTVTEEKISRMAGGRSGMSMSRQDLEAVIKRAGLIPVERDTLYHPILREPAEETPLLITKDPVLREPKDDASEEWLRLTENMELHDLWHKAYQVSPSAISVSSMIPWDGQDKSMAAFTKWLLDLDPITQKIQTIVLDFSHLHEEPSWSLDGFFAEMSPYKGRFSIAVMGFHGLWRLIQKAALSIDDATCKLAEIGVRTVEAAHEEHDGIMTDSELFALHLACHKAEIATVGKIEVSISPRGKMLWSSIYRRLQMYRRLQEHSRGLLGLTVVPAKEPMMTSLEYLRALAVLRLSTRNWVAQLITPLNHIPTLSMPSGLGTKYTQHPTEKLIGLLTMVGATDFGYLDFKGNDGQTSWDFKSLSDEVSFVGKGLCKRDARFHAAQDQDNLH